MEKQINVSKIINRLQDAKTSLLSKAPFYALLLMSMKFAIDENCETVYTDGIRVTFNPDFILSLADSELEFILMHEVLHAALGHPFRSRPGYHLEYYDKACDIVVNSNILLSFNMDYSKIMLQNKIAANKTPSGEDGYNFTAEQIYRQFVDYYGLPKAKLPSKTGEVSLESSEEESAESDDKAKKEDAVLNNADTDEEVENKEDSDEAKDAEKESALKSDEKSEDGQSAEGDATAENCEKSESNGNSENSLEDLIESLKARNQELREKYKNELTIKAKKDIEVMVEPVDDHSYWNYDDEEAIVQSKWDGIVMKAVNITMEKEKSHKGFGGAPACMIRKYKELTEPEVDWRAALNEFVQEEINDYSFSPPDKRMDDCPFFLPDFNEKDESIKNVWFLIDTSGSIGDKEIAAAYSEIISAMDMFNNKLQGLLSFTEVKVTEPIPFCSVEELLEIKPVGGGGNDFGEIFRYMAANMMDDPPTSVIIFTDGYDTYPPESAALGVPVFWLINNEDAKPPVWGRWARFKIHDKKV